MVNRMAGSLFNGRAALAALLAAILLASFWAGLLASPAPDRAGAVAAQRACANADSPPPAVTRSEMRKALACLLRRERAQRDRKRVKPNAALNRVAQKHTRKMVKQNCFRHQCKGEDPLGKRIEDSGYLKPGDRYGFGQILGCATTPRKMVEQWMRKRAARRTILDRSFRHLGVGAVKGAPKVVESCQVPNAYATYTALFAWRRG